MTIKKYAGDKITGLSSDTKPTNVVDGATFYELDTKKVYQRYSSTWVEIETTTGQAAFDKANSANVLAQAAFNTANTDVTSVSTVAGVFGNSSIVPVVSVVANGRVISVTNTNIAIDTSQITSGTLASARLSGAYTGITGVGTLTNGTWTANSISTTYTAAKITTVGDQTGAISNTQILDFVKAVDGSGSGLDADLLDGLNSTSFANSNYATAAFDKANSANVLAQAAFDTANAGSGGIQTYSANVGDGTNTSFTITHSLNKSNILVNVRENANGYFVYPDVKYTSVNDIVLEFVDAPTSNQYFVSVFG